MSEKHLTDNISLSEHFKFAEFTKTNYKEFKARQHNEALRYMVELNDLCRLILEPARALLGVPMIITSGFRCYALNEKINGSVSSQHRFGEAADFVPVGMSVAEAFDILKDSDIPFGQLILEQKGGSS